MKKIYTLKCLSGFRDGNVFPRFINPGEVLEEVDERLYHRFIQSDPEGFEVLEVQTIIPPPTKSEPKVEEEEDSDGNEG